MEIRPGEAEAAEDRAAESARRAIRQCADLSKPDRMHARVNDAAEQRLGNITCGIMTGKPTERAGGSPGSARPSGTSTGEAEAFGDCRRCLLRTPRGWHDGGLVPRRFTENVLSGGPDVRAGRERGARQRAGVQRGALPRRRNSRGGQWNRKKADATATLRRGERKSFCSRLDKAK